jgi:hypothetical protein
MENNKIQVPAVEAGGAVGRGLATELPASGQELRATIRKHGRGMNSNKLERRYLYLYVSPFSDDDLETGVRRAVDTINQLLAIWEPPLRRGFLRPDMWWQHVPCSHCKRRMEYEVEKWRAGEYVWRRNMCLRHWFVHHLSMVAPYEPSGLISNRPISIEADVAKIRFNIETVNYRYDIMLTKEIAKMHVEYKGKTYMFSFSNHLRDYPYLSSYMNILIDAHNALEVFRDFLTDYVLKRRLYSNVIINDVFTIPPADSCNTCRL